MYDPDNQRTLNLEQSNNGVLTTRSTSVNGDSSTVLSSGTNASDVDARVFQETSSSTLNGTNFYSFVEGNILYSIPVDGSSAAIRISPNFPSTTKINVLAPSGNRQEIIFSASDTNSNSEFIYIASIDGSESALLLTELPENVFINFNRKNTFSFKLV